MSRARLCYDVIALMQAYGFDTPRMRCLPC